MDLKEKQLLLADLCARSPYNVKCKVHLDTKGYCLRDEDKYCDDTLESVNCKKQTCTFKKSIGYKFGNFAIEEVKPYLRPMSSMTEEEFEKLKEYSGLKYEQLDLASYQNGTYKCLDFYLSEVPSDVVVLVFDWLYQHHFDFRGLISLGLALEAPKGMY